MLPRPLTRTVFFRYGLAILGTALGMPLDLLLQGVLPATTVFLSIVVIVSWFGGLGPGLVSALLSTLVIDYSFTPPLYSLNLTNKDVSGLIVFALYAALVGWASAGRRRAQDTIAAARDATEEEVRARTADLKRTNAQLEAEIVERKRAQAEIEDLAGRLIHAQELERSRIGRELHDHISQRLGLLAIKIDQLRVDSVQTTPAAPALDELQQHTREITRDVHGLSHRLHSSMLDYLGLTPALQRLVTEFSERHGLAITFQPTPLPGPISSELALCLFRIAEESLNNVVKHSSSPSARVALTADEDARGVTLTIEDQGAGFEPAILEAKAGLGFVSMRERMRLVRGRIVVTAAPARGTRIEAWAPFDPAAGADA